MKKVKHKRPQDESFPVGKLVKKSLRPLVLAYYNAARRADDIADAQNLTREEKLAQLAETARAFHNKEAEGQFRAAADLGKLFGMENLANTLFLDLLTAFERDAENRQPEIWEQLIDYCKYLCAALQIVNHIQDLKEDAVKLRRFYLPAEMMKRHGAENSDIYLSFMTPPLKKVVGEVLENVKGMLKDSEVLPSLISSFRLRAEVGVILSLTNSVVKRLEKGDVLAQRIRPSGWDWVKAWFNGWKTALSGKKRTVRMAK
ncbi:MAG: squalene/phytoene synthase family protein [Proteobacteria bacterium]|nr:squalene/phytoene synthase family protein [Pseudomonadota bacterium]